MPRADAVIWLDPPNYLRAWRLALRPWRNFGMSRPELPLGNRDWPFEQYRFGFKSLKRGAELRAQIAATLQTHGGTKIWRCKTQTDIEAAVRDFVNSGSV
ncbi:MAG: hypothetical protein ACPGNV_07415 [Mangrovicoccus sp.]